MQIYYPLLKTIFIAVDITYLHACKPIKHPKLSDGDGHLGLVVVILVDGRPQRVQRLGEFLVRVRLDRERLGHRQHLQIK